MKSIAAVLVTAACCVSALPAATEPAVTGSTATMPPLPAPALTGDERQAALAAVLAGQQAISVLVGELVYQVTPPDAGDGMAVRTTAWDIDFIIVLPDAYAISSQPTNGEEVDWYCSDGKQRWQASQWAPDEAPEVDPPKPVAEGEAGLARVSRFLALDTAALSEDFTVAITTLLVSDGGEVSGGEASGDVVSGYVLNLVPLRPDEAEHVKWLQVTLKAILAANDAEGDAVAAGDPEAATKPQASGLLQTTQVVMADAKDNILTFDVSWSRRDQKIDASACAWPQAARQLLGLRDLRPREQ